MVQAEEVQLNGEEVLEKSAPEIGVNTDLLREMTVAGLFLGRKKSKTHPRMKQFIFATRNGVEIINLAETSLALLRVENILAEMVGANKQVLVVGTQPAAQAAVEQFAKQFNFPYVTQRWLGGTLTNFDTIQKRMDYYKKLKDGFATGGFEQYTKKEQLEFQRELNRLEILFGGIVSMNKLPGALLVIGVNQHSHAIREGKRLGIPVIAVMNTDANPDSVDCAVPANDISKSSIEWLMGYFAKAVEKAKSAKVVA